MKYERLKIVLALVIFCIVSTFALAQQAAPLPKKHAVDWNAPRVPGMLLVGFHETASRSIRDSVHATIGTTKLNSFHLIPVDLVKVPENADLQMIAAAYFARAEIDYVEPNYIFHAIRSTQPNDPDFDQQWGLDEGTYNCDIDAPEAWDTRTSAQDIIVAVIGSGIDYYHEDLADNMWINEAELYGNPDEDDNDPPNGVKDEIYGARFTSGNANGVPGPIDEYGHETAVAGIIGAYGNNGTGVTGACWRVKLMAVRWLDETGDGDNADAAAAIQYAVDTGAHLINASWGYGSNTIKNSIKAAGEAGMLFVAAAGNDAKNTETSPDFPSSYEYPWIIAVAATINDGSVADFSNYGKTRVDIGAPGELIYSTLLNDSYGLFEQDGKGTSFAAPFVSGVCALLWAEKPSAPAWQIKAWVLGGTDYDARYEDLWVTEGRLNADKALACPDFTWTIKDSNSCVVEAFDEIANLFVYGLYKEGYTQSPDANTIWQLKNSQGTPKIWISHDSAQYGDQTTLYLTGEIKSSIGDLTNETFVIKDTSGSKILAADAENGHLWVDGLVITGTGGE